MKGTLLFTLKFALTFIVVSALCFYFAAGFLVSLFMDNAEIIAYGSAFLRGFCLGLPFLCVDFVAVGVFQACGLGKNAFIFAVLRKIVLEIPALYLLNTLFPLYGLPYARLVAELILCIAAIVVLRRLFAVLHRKFPESDSLKQVPFQQ